MRRWLRRHRSPLTEDHAKLNFPFLFGTSGFPPIRDVDRLKSRCLGDRAPITLATLWGVSTSPKKEGEIQFCVVLRIYPDFKGPNSAEESVVMQKNDIEKL